MSKTKQKLEGEVLQILAPDWKKQMSRAAGRDWPIEDRPFAKVLPHVTLGFDHYENLYGHVRISQCISPMFRMIVMQTGKAADWSSGDGIIGEQISHMLRAFESNKDRARRQLTKLEFSHLLKTLPCRVKYLYLSEEGAPLSRETLNNLDCFVEEANNHRLSKLNSLIIGQVLGCHYFAFKNSHWQFLNSRIERLIVNATIKPALLRYLVTLGKLEEIHVRLKSYWAVDPVENEDFLDSFHMILHQHCAKTRRKLKVIMHCPNSPREATSKDFLSEYLIDKLIKLQRVAKSVEFGYNSDVRCQTMDGFKKVLPLVGEGTLCLQIGMEFLVHENPRVSALFAECIQKYCSLEKMLQMLPNDLKYLNCCGKRESDTLMRETTAYLKRNLRLKGLHTYRDATSIQFYRALVYHPSLDTTNVFFNTNGKLKWKQIFYNSRTPEAIGFVRFVVFHNKIPKQMPLDLLKIVADMLLGPKEDRTALVPRFGLHFRVETDQFSYPAPYFTPVLVEEEEEVPELEETE